MITLVNNCFSTDNEIQNATIDKIYGNNKKIIYPLNDDLLSSDRNILNAYVNTKKFSDYKKKNYVILCMYNYKSIHVFKSIIGTKYITFTNILRPSKEFFEVFNEKQYNSKKYSDIHGFFEVLENGLDLYKHEINTIFFNEYKDIAENEYRIRSSENYQKIYNEFKSSFLQI